MSAIFMHTLNNRGEMCKNVKHALQFLMGHFKQPSGKTMSAKAPAEHRTNTEKEEENMKPAGKKMLQFLGKIQRHILYKYQLKTLALIQNSVSIQYLFYVAFRLQSFCVMSIFISLVQYVSD